jgi:hypothetical protein
MKALFRIFAFSLCAALVIFCPPASAQSRGVDACSVFARGITPDISRFKCLQLHGQQAEFRAAAEAKAAAGRAARAPAATAVPRANAAVGTFTTFDAPGAVFGTFPTGINPAAAITGFYFDANFGGHGFLRLSNGIITTFDAPGAVGTFPDSISPAGAIAGTYNDANFAAHGFLRASNGTITTFDAPGAGTGTGFSQGTNPLGITPGGRSRASIMT